MKRSRTHWIGAGLGASATLIIVAVCLARQAATTALNAKPSFTDIELSRIVEHSPLGTPPQDGNRLADDPRAARLGQFLFYDSRISGSGKFSCATCHDPALAFTDGKPIAEATGKTTRNALSLMNVAYNRWYFWDGRADSLWSQALKPMEHPAELAGSRLQIAHLIDDDSQLRGSYESIFGKLQDLRDASRFPKRGGPSDCIGEGEFSRAWQKMQAQDQEAINRIFSNIGKSIASYERQLVSRRAPFDIFVEGLREDDAQKQQTLSESARRGLKLFVGRGECRLCHSGPNFTDGEFHDIGIPPRGGAGQVDPGRFDGVKKLLADPFNAAGKFGDDPNSEAAQRLEFLVDGTQNFAQVKTPSLRNVALTAPYMHQGQIARLEDVMIYYSTLAGARLGGDHRGETILRPRDFSKEEIADLIAFLQSLTDLNLDKSLFAKPDSPALTTSPAQASRAH